MVEQLDTGSWPVEAVQYWMKFWPQSRVYDTVEMEKPLAAFTEWKDMVGI